MRGQLDFILGAVTGTNNVNILDDLGVPSTMVKIPKFKISDVISGGPAVTHPMFIVDGVEKDAIYIGKFESIVSNSRAYSLPGRVPYNKASFSDMIQYCRNKGEGWHAMTNAEYAGMSLWSRANGTLPRGNDYAGRSNRKTFERGKCVDYTTYSDDNTISNSDHYAGEQIKLDWTGDLQDVDLTGISSFKLDSYSPGSVDGSITSGCASGVVTVPSGVTKLTANIKRRIDKLHDIPTVVIPKGTSTYSTTSVHSATVIKRGENDYYTIFCGSDGTTLRLLYATSTDGVNWGTPLKLFSTDIVTSTNTSLGIVPSLLKDTNGTYRLWFVKEGVLYYTESKDNCVTWLVPTSLKVSHPFTTLLQVRVIQDDDTTFKLYFNGSDTTGLSTKIGMGISADGTTIGTVSTLFTIGGTYETYSISGPVVYKEDSMYYMFYHAKTDADTGYVKFRISGDGIVWGTGYLLMRSGNISGDVKGATPRQFMLDDGKYVLYYAGLSLDGTGQLCRTTFTTLPNLFDNVYKFGNGKRINLSNDYLPEDHNAIMAPGTVIYDNGVYKGWGGAVGATTTNIQYMTSTDSRNWTVKQSITLSGISGATTSFVPGTVIKDGTTYKMWYTETYQSSGIEKHNILYAESTDGITWGTPSLVFDETAITDATAGSSTLIYFISVVESGDGKYRAILDVGIPTGRALYYADSTDGKTWSTITRVIDVTTTTSITATGGYAGPKVVYSNSKYRMVFIGNKSGHWYCLYAESTDMKTWTNFSTIMKPDTRAYNTGTGGIWNPVFHYDGTTYRLIMINASGGLTGYNYINTQLESTDCATWSDPIATDVSMTNLSYMTGLTARNGSATLTVLSTTKAKTFIAGEKIRFNCTGTSIKLNTNNATKIKIECYGASGGDNTLGTLTSIGGKGGYAYGEFSTTKAIDLYLNVGGRGGFSNDAPNIGFNGGGYIYSPTIASYKFYGGGATDVRNVASDITRRLIVAGGGGTGNISSTNATSGAAGGGFTGGSGTTNNSGYSTTGGTQSSHGTYDAISLTNYSGKDVTPDQSYGTCLDYTNGSIDPSVCSPGGGGFYGGGSSAGASGAGGSSYISGNVNCTYLHPDSLTLANSGSSSGLNTEKDGYIILTILETTDTKRYNVGDKVRFNYTGAPQTFIQGNATQVQVECYGASGGYTDQESKGGYATGILSLAKVDVLSVIVGGMGKAGTKGAAGKGGYNGGGDGGAPLSDIYYGGCGGGGATDVRSVFDTDLFAADSLASRLVVAGAGGGQCSTSTPGDGGGWSGTTATSLSSDGSSLPGSQKIGYSLGQGGAGDSATVMNDGSNEGNGGGGGGYYGGYGGLKLNNGTNNDTSGAGGSSYVAGDTNCPTAHSSGITLSSTGTTASANTGDGYVIITITAVTTDRKYISGEKFTFNNINDVQSFSTKNAKRIRIECFGAEGAKGDETCGEPGKGGYVSGEMILNTAQTLQLYVGGKGGYNTGSIGGFNGGGQATSNIDNKVYYGSGASDVRTVQGDLTSRLIVAGAGGSATKDISTAKFSPTQMVMDIGNPEKGYRSTGVTAPTVINDNGTYKAWFSGYNGTNWRIFYTTSPDGKNWYNPVMVMDVGTNAAGYNSASSYIQSVIKDGDTYKMWFTGGNGTNSRILYSTSSDGKNWSIPILVMDKGVVSSGYTSVASEYPCVIKDGSTYKMWFTGYDGTNMRILYTTSDNGINWVTPVLAMDKGTNASGYNSVQSSSPAVIKDGTTYRMILTGSNGTNGRLLYSTSTDGITWTAPILAMDKGTNVAGYSSTNIANAGFINDNGTYKLWSTGYNGTNWRILYSTSTDLATWTVPVLSINKGPAAGGYNVSNNYTETVISDGGIYKMWFGGSDGTNRRILYSTSVDMITWTAPVLAIDVGSNINGYNTLSCYGPTVIKDGSTYKMWFGCSDGTNDRILYSTSSDGLIWTAPVLAVNKGTNANGYNSVASTYPNVIKESATSYKMWLAGSDGTTWRILYSTSTDGVTWTAPILAVGNSTAYNASSFCPSVIKGTSGYQMWFSGYGSDVHNRIMYTTSTDGVTWTTPVVAIDIGTSTYTANHITTPCVILEGSVYKMLAVSNDGNYVNGRILYATSTNGTTWTVPRLSLDIGSAYGTYMTKTLNWQTVIKDGSIYKMWITGYDGTNYRILYSTSADCVNWSMPILSMNIGTNASGYNSVLSYGPSIIKESSTSYKMWFSCSNGTNNRILYSTSTDGITWTAPVLAMNIGTNASGYNSTESEGPTVIKDGSTYKMWFDGYDGSHFRILYSTSTDGITWTAPVLAMNYGTSAAGYSSTNIARPHVIKDGSIYKMWFAGTNGTNWRTLYTTSTDGVNWNAPTLALDCKDSVYDSTGVLFPTVIKDGSTYRMFACGYDGTTYRLLYSYKAVDESVTPVDGYDGGDINASALIEAGIVWDTPALTFDNGKSMYNTSQSIGPCIIKDGITYKMWFAGYNGSNYRILYTTSDDLINWTIPQLVMNIGTCAYNTTHSSAPKVIKDGNTYKMWFSGYYSGVYKILYSISTDGISWSTPVMSMNIGTCSYNGSGSMNQSVIKDGNTYKMWFSGFDGTNWRILYSTSTDGINWSTPILALDKNLTTYNTTHNDWATVIKEGSVYKMWFAGYNGSNWRILYSTSTDGINWSTPVLATDISTTAYNTNSNISAYVIKDGDVYRLWFAGYDSSNWRILSTASKSYSTQLVGTTLPYTDPELTNYGTGTKIAQKGTGATFQALGQQYESFLAAYSTLMAPGAGGWFGGLTYNGPGMGGNSYIAGNKYCPTSHPDNTMLFNTSYKPGVNTGDGKIIITILETDIDFKFQVGDRICFKYTGAPEQFLMRNATRIKMELWGACDKWASSNPLWQKGRGGYVYGEYDALKNKISTLNVVVGQAGTVGTNSTPGVGGYNGGGNGGSSYTSSFWCGNGGGGATDVRTSDNTNIMDVTALASRLIVAGGGAGCGAGGNTSFYGGNGGDWSGAAGSGSGNCSSVPGTQTTGYAQGQGGKGSSAITSNNVDAEGNGGGGGGYYGGYGGLKLNSGTYSDAGGGGGSSYAAGNANCPAAQSDGIILTNTGTIAGYNYFSSGNGFAMFTVLATDDNVYAIDNSLVYTGTGRPTWSHDGQPTGIYDLVGNLQTLCTGLRVNGTTKEVQIIPNNNAAKFNIDFTDESNWLALGSDGSAVAKGLGSKYTNSIVGTVSLSYSALTMDSSSYIHKALGLVPAETGYDYESAAFTFQNLNSNTLMNLCYRGGGVGDASTINSIFSALFKQVGNGDIDAIRGFRVCYYEP